MDEELEAVDKDGKAVKKDEEVVDEKGRQSKWRRRW